LLLRIGPQCKAAVLHDSLLREVNAIAVDARDDLRRRTRRRGEPALCFSRWQPTPAGTPPPRAGATADAVGIGKAAHRLHHCRLRRRRAGVAPRRARSRPSGRHRHHRWSAAARSRSSPSEIRLGLRTGEPGRPPADRRPGGYLPRMPESQVTALRARGVTRPPARQADLRPRQGAGESGPICRATPGRRRAVISGATACKARVGIATRTGSARFPMAPAATGRPPIPAPRTPVPVRWPASYRARPAVARRPGRAIPHVSVACAFNSAPLVDAIGAAARVIRERCRTSPSGIGRLAFQRHRSGAAARTMAGRPTR
jgi:hypothetical protein